MVAQARSPVSNSWLVRRVHLVMVVMVIDMYIFEFWTIQLKILLVPGRCRVPIDYTFMPHDVENLLSI